MLYLFVARCNLTNNWRANQLYCHSYMMKCAPSLCASSCSWSLLPLRAKVKLDTNFVMSRCDVQKILVDVVLVRKSFKNTPNHIKVGGLCLRTYTAEIIHL